MYFFCFFFFLLRFFKISQKWLKLFWLKKFGRNHGISVYKKALISVHRKNYIFRDNHCFVKMSASTLVHALPFFFYPIDILNYLISKIIIYRNTFIFNFNSFRKLCTCFRLLTKYDIYFQVGGGIWPWNNYISSMKLTYVIFSYCILSHLYLGCSYFFFISIFPFYLISLYTIFY